LGNVHCLRYTLTALLINGALLPAAAGATILLLLACWHVDGALTRLQSIVFRLINNKLPTVELSSGHT
jgi:hypothetical protein